MKCSFFIRIIHIAVLFLLTSFSLLAQYTGGNGSGANADVFIAPPPVIGVSASGNNICLGQSAVITPSGASTYTLLPGNITGTSFTVTPNSTTTYTIDATNAGACLSATATIPITVNQTPVISIVSTSSNSICSGQSTVITPTGAATYTLMPNNISGTSFTVNPTSSVTYTIIGTSAQGCVSQSCNGTPGINLITNGDFEAGNTGFTTGYTYNSSLFAPNNYNVGSNPNNYHPSFSTCTDHTSGSGNMYIANGATLTPAATVWSQTVAVSPNTNYNFSAWAASPAGASCGNCLADLKFSVNGTAMGSTFSPSTTACTWSQFTNVWNSGANTSAVISIVDTNTVSYGNDFMIDDISFTSNCTRQDTVSVAVNPLPTISINASSKTVCSGSSATLTANGATTYTWSTNATTNAVSVNPNTTTSYTVIGTSGSCTNSAVASVSVTATPTVSINASSTSICSGSSSTLSASGATSYTWSTNATTNLISVSPSSSATYTLIGANGICSDTTTTTIAVNLTPTISIISVSKDSICPGQSTVIIPGGASTYTMMPGGAAGTSFTVNPTTTTAYTISGTSAQGCTASASTDPTTTITVNPGALASFTATPTGGAAPLGVLFTNTSLGTGNTYTWNMGNGSTTFTAQNAAYTYTSAGTYTITLTADNGLCPATTYTLLIQVEQGATIIIPNVFTPNGDGVNDGFFVTTTAIKDLEVNIFDRWGIKVWQMQGLTSVWAGHGLNGNKMTDGTYFYILRATDVYGKSYDKTGNILLIR